MARCFVHIGVPKTGTTYLQQLCWDNRSALLDAGILYPSAGSRRGGHHDYAFLIADGYPEWATPQPRSLAELEKDLAQELSSAPHSSVLLSSEDFYMFPRPDELLALLERTGALNDREPAIIVYLRRQDSAHESWYNQTIKALGYDHTLDECIERFRNWWDYDANLQRWGAVFGQDALHVRVYEDRQFTGGTLARDFFSVLGVPELDITIPQERVNTGLNYDLLQIQRCINRLPLSVLEKRRFHKQMIDLSQRTHGMGLFDEAPAIDNARAAAIMQTYAAGNEAVAKRYFARNELFFDVLNGSQSERTSRGGITAEKLLYFLGWILARDA